MEQYYGTHIKVRRRRISLTSFYTGEQTNDAKKNRACISGWNDGMARRLGNYLDNFRQDFTGMVTLTYGERYPRDGRIVKNHWRAFIERLRRTGWFEEQGLVWFLEFQDRGAPHFHYLATGWISKNWVAENWADITGGDAAACSRVESLRHPECAGAYARKYAQKSAQKILPDDFKHIGRMWGCCARKFVAGKARQPVEAAALKGLLPVHFKDTLNKCEFEYGVKVIETESGLVIYGSEKQIKQVRNWICRKFAITNLSGNSQDAIVRRMQAG